METLTLDFTNPIIDLSYEHLQTLKLQQISFDTQALILTGNEFEDLNFLRKFPNLQLLFLDSTQIGDFYEVRNDLLGQLRYLSVRL